jgi:hypothetical protein
VRFVVPTSLREGLDLVGRQPVISAPIPASASLRCDSSSAGLSLNLLMIIAIGVAFAKQRHASPRRQARRRCRASGSGPCRPASPCRWRRCRWRRSSRRAPCGPDGVGHHVDLGRTGLVPQITTQSDLAISRGSGPAGPGAHDIAGPGHVGADRVELVGIALGVAETMDPVALHLPHGAGVKIRPDGLGAELRFRLFEELSAIRSSAASQTPLSTRPRPWRLADQWLEQPVGVVDALGVARHLGADNAGGVAVVRVAAHPADAVVCKQIDLERTGRRAVVRTG